MRTFRIASEGARALTTHKLRAFFMMAGTTVGIAALTVIMAVGKGTERKVMERVESLGLRAIMLIAGGGKNLPPPDMTVTTLSLEDADAVRQEIHGIEIVSPMAWSFQMGVRREGKDYQAVVWGVEPNWHDAWKWYAGAGDGIAPEDVATLARVCVIGETIRRELFGDENPVGEHVYINNVSLTVKGVLEKRGVSPMGGDFDNRVVLPITTAMRRVMNIDHLGAIRIITSEPSRLHEQTEAIRALLHERHHITPPEEDDFRLVTPLVIADMARGTSRTLSILLIALAALSLLVGGVVLMNILLISVSERKREIGLRRAVGAAQHDILVQFLTESLAVTFLGMAAGCLLGVGICLALRQATVLPVALSWEPVVLGLVFAIMVGTFFGVQPARKAARLNPVDALR